MRAATAGVALVGLAIAVYLVAAGGEPACFIAHGCSVVQHSSYAKLAGVPVAWLGLAGYVGILASLVRDTEWTRTIGAGLALVGAGFSGWLTYVEVARLDAICAWCVSSAVCMVLLAVLTVIRLSRTPAGPAARPARAPRSSGATPSHR